MKENSGSNEFKLRLPEGFVVKINDIPFRLEESVLISGHKRNFVIANLLKESETTG